MIPCLIHYYSQLNLYECLIVVHLVRNDLYKVALSVFARGLPGRHLLGPSKAR